MQLILTALHRPDKVYLLLQARNTTEHYLERTRMNKCRTYRFVVNACVTVQVGTYLSTYCRYYVLLVRYVRYLTS